MGPNDRFKINQQNNRIKEDPNAAPLEQNIKNLDCNGVPYKVVREDVQNPSKNNKTDFLAISPSRKAQRREIMSASAATRKDKKTLGRHK